MAILGLDVGEKRIGVALAQERVAIPLTVIERSGARADMERVLALIQKHGVERIVVGLPRSLDGSIGQQASMTLAFVGELSQCTGVPVDTWDERLSTVSAERLLLDTGMKREKRKARRDATAAAIILQSYLDSIGT